MKKLLIATSTSLIAAPALAHEIGVTHGHAGPIVLMELPMPLIFGAGIALAAFVGVAIYLRKSRGNENDPR